MIFTVKDLITELYNNRIQIDFNPNMPFLLNNNYSWFQIYVHCLQEKRRNPGSDEAGRNKVETYINMLELSSDYIQAISIELERDNDYINA